MSSGQVVELLQQALITTAVVGGPILVVTLAVGLIVSVVQAATQINESTLTFLPKVIVVAGLLWLGGAWMLSEIVNFTRMVIEAMPGVAR